MIMEAIRRFIDAEELMSILALPLKSLLGAIPNTNLSLEELRNERLSKYEIND